MKIRLYIVLGGFLIMSACTQKQGLALEVYETSSAGNKLSKISEFAVSESKDTITLNPEKTYQKITGFGGAFTESSAYLLNKLSSENRKKILEAYF